MPEYIELGRQPGHVRPPIAPGLRVTIKDCTRLQDSRDGQEVVQGLEDHESGVSQRKGKAKKISQHFPPYPQLLGKLQSTQSQCNPGILEQITKCQGNL